MSTTFTNPILLPRENYVWYAISSRPETVRLMYIFPDKIHTDVIGVVIDNIPSWWNNDTGGWAPISHEVDMLREAMRIVEIYESTVVVPKTKYSTVEKDAEEHKVSVSYLLGEQK